MRWLIHVFKSRAFLIGLGILLLIALLGFVGLWFEWSQTTILLSVVGVLVLCVLLLVVSMVRANRSAAAIEQSILSQAELQLQSTRPDKQAEIEELQKQLESAISTLKKSKLGKSRGRSALYALPWYMFIGPSAAGKTTAITQSGLNFPLGLDRIRGVGGTRNCDWFFADTAIFLDTAGRYITEQEDEAEWLAFLETLKKNRKSQPINGVMVGISAAELAEASSDQIEWHAENIRRRVDELVQRLGVRVPVYLLFTKCDLLNGFVEFFEALSKRERSQVWGYTLEQSSDAEPDVLTMFEREFQRLSDILINKRTARLSQPMKRAERQKVFVFPLEFAGLKDPLGRFVERLFQTNPYQESPILRGFYFTSGTQEGVPIDRVIQQIARQFDLPSEIPGEGEIGLETKSYFIQNLFTDVIIPDQYMVQPTSKAAQRGRLVRVGMVAASVLGLVLFVLAASFALASSKRSLNRVQSASEAVAAVKWSSPSQVPANLKRLDILRGEVAKLEGHASFPPLLQIGLDRGGTVLKPARALYYDKVGELVETYAYRPMVQRLRAASRQRRIESDRREGLYNDLKAYLLMSSDVQRLEDEANRNFLQRYLAELLNGAIKKGNEEASVTDHLKQQVTFFAEGLRKGTTKPIAHDNTVVTRMRNLLYEKPSIASVYSRLKQEGRDLLPPYTLADALQGRNLDLFADDAVEVSGFFTKDGWTRFAKDRFDKESENPAGDDWVMGVKGGELPPSMLNKSEMVSELESLYYTDYALEWERFLQSVRFRSFEDVQTSARYLNTLSNQGDSPILWLLAQVSNETSFSGGVLGAALEGAGSRAKAGETLLGGKTRSAISRARRVLGGGKKDDDNGPQNPVEKRFSALHALKANEAADGTAATGLVQALESLGRVGSVLDGIKSDDAQASEYAARVFEQDGGDLSRELRAIQNALVRIDPKARRSLFEAPIQQAWRTILAAAQRHLDTRWKEDVYGPFQATLADHYPLNLNSDFDIPLADFENFFRPDNGIVATFKKEQLAPFLTRDGRRPRQWEGRGITLSREGLTVLARADEIASGLFAGGALQLKFDLQAELPEREPNAPPVDEVRIQVHGIEEAYNMGSFRPWKEFVWPGRSGARLEVSTQRGDLRAIHFDDAWAWFRLLQ